jgi:hypothetical protein
MIKKQEIFIIKDWAGNILHYNGRFTLPCYAVPMEFTGFQDAWEWIYSLPADENGEYDDFYVEAV